MGSEPARSYGEHRMCLLCRLVLPAHWARGRSFRFPWLSGIPRRHHHRGGLSTPAPKPHSSSTSGPPGWTTCTDVFNKSGLLILKYSLTSQTYLLEELGRIRAIWSQINLVFSKALTQLNLVIGAFTPRNVNIL